MPDTGSTSTVEVGWFPTSFLRSSHYGRPDLRTLKDLMRLASEAIAVSRPNIAVRANMTGADHSLRFWSSS